MLVRSGTTLAALQRWEDAALVDAATAARLRADVEAYAESERLRFARLALAVTAAAILVIATVTFFAWVWPSLAVGVRSGLVAVVGGVLAAAGNGLERRMRARPEPWYLLQTAGLLMIGAAAAFSAEAWPDRTTGGAVVGALTLAVSLAALWWYAQRSPVMTTISLVLGYGFLYLALLRAFGFRGANHIWVVDAVFVLVSAALVLVLRSAAAREWQLHSLVASIYLAPLFVFTTAVGPLHIHAANAVWPIDAWFVAAVALNLWAVHRVPERWYRDWYEQGLVVAALIAIPLAFWTTLGALDSPPEIAAIAVLAVGALAMHRALAHGDRQLLVAGAFALVTAAWYYANARGQALAAVLALTFTAAVLFWVSLRVGKGPRSAREP